MRRLTAACASFGLAFSTGMHNPALAAQTAISGRCAAPVYRQFDFWIGDWDAFDIAAAGPAVARTRVDRFLDGCVLLERYDGADGHDGESFSIFDASKKRWQQIWVTNGGQLLEITGGVENGAMILRGSYIARDGKNTAVIGTWKAVTGGVRETGVISTDGGKTWKPWFDIVFRHHRA